MFHGLWRSWGLGQVRLDEIRVLFSDAATVKLLNTVTGGVLLWDVQHLLMDDLMRCVTRLTDQKRSGGKENLTVRWLPEVAVPAACSRPGRLRGPCRRPRPPWASSGDNP